MEQSLPLETMCPSAAWGGVIEIGNNVFFNNGTSITAKEKIEIGDNCIFGENVKIYDHNHVFKELQKPIMEQGFSTKEIHIGSNCWLGSNVVVLRGANIGDNCVIGAGCIVSGDVPCNSLVRSVSNQTIEARKDIQDG